MPEPTRTDPDPGLCATCRHARRVDTPRTRYWLCQLSFTDERFDKYPRLPVRTCDGYRPIEGEPSRDR